MAQPSNAKLTTRLKYLQSLPEAIRGPYWRWSIVLSAAIDPSFDLKELDSDRSCLETCKWYRKYMATGDPGVREMFQAHAIYMQQVPFARKWLLEALLVAGEDPAKIALRFSNMNERTVRQYESIYYNIGKLHKNTMDLLSFIMVFSTEDYYDRIWKLFSAEFGADDFIRLVERSELSEMHQKWFARQIKKGLYLKTTASTSDLTKFWSEDIDRLITTARGSLKLLEADDKPPETMPQITAFLQKLTIRLEDTEKTAEARQYFEIPEKVIDIQPIVKQITTGVEQCQTE